MKISEIIVESSQLNENEILTEGAKDIFKKIMLGATFAAAAAGASAQDAASFLSAIKKNPEQAQRLFANNPEAMKQIAAMSRSAAGYGTPPDRSESALKKRADSILNDDIPHSKANVLGKLKAYVDFPQTPPDVKKKINDVLSAEKSSIDLRPDSFKKSYDETTKYSKKKSSTDIVDDVKRTFDDIVAEKQLVVKLKKLYDSSNYKAVSDVYGEFIGS